MNLLSLPGPHRWLIARLITIVVTSLLGLSVALAQTNSILIKEAIANGQGINLNGGELPVSVNELGDIDKDGYPDFVIGDTLSGDIQENPGGITSATGGAFVIFGGPRLVNNIDLERLDGTNGFFIAGEDFGDGAGTDVSKAGDINKDGFDDLLIGSNVNVYVVFGQAQFPPRFELSQLDGRNGFVVPGSRGGVIGLSVSDAGDMNNDGYADIAFNDYAATFDGLGFAGKVYVVYGQPTFPATFDLTSLDGRNGFVVGGQYSVGMLGEFSISSVGDINNDGFDDFSFDESFKLESPAFRTTHVLLGGNAFPGQFSTSEIAGRYGISIVDSETTRTEPMITNAAGDVNVDGIDDFSIGIPTKPIDGAEQEGKSYLVFGRASFEEKIDLAELDGVTGFSLSGGRRGSLTGRGRGSVGDINNDGYSDIAIGAPGVMVIYFVFGQPAFDASINLLELDERSDFTLRSGVFLDRFGNAFDDVGDINADGVDDFVVSSFRLLSGERFPASYVVFGRADWISDATPSPSCGRPRIDSAADQGIFLWQDCPNGTPNGDWHMLATAGGSATTVKYSGVLESNSLEATPIRYESSDSFQSDTNSVAFVMRVVNTWADGIEFTTAPNASICSVTIR